MGLEVLMSETIIRCSICGKHMMDRDESGKLIFRFGLNPNGIEIMQPMIDMEIIGGQVRMHCIRKSCRRKNPNHWNIINNQENKEV